MANLKVIRRRITSVRNTQKITRAMKMVAAAKLKRSQETMEKFRSYADLTASILSEVAAGSSAEDHPLLKRREPKKSLLVMICSDRGLCGGFNGNLCREVFSRVQKTDPGPAISIIGRKAVDYFERRPVTIDTKYTGVYDNPGYETAAEIARGLAKRYSEKEIDRIDLVYNEFVSMIAQKPTFRQLLPVVLPEKRSEDADEWIPPTDFIFEPNRAELLGELLPKYVEVQIYRALIESMAAEHAARWTTQRKTPRKCWITSRWFTTERGRARLQAS
jgi:F-type H+-transporting ATPase subunit gamma